MEQFGLGLAALAAITLPRFIRPFSPFFFSLAGLFVVSLVSNATPFFGASYTLVATAELIAFGFSPEAFILVVGITALGAAVGKLVIYLGAIGFGRRLSRNRNVQLRARWLERRWFLAAVFIAAVIPLLPIDDYIYLGAGAKRSRFFSIGAVTVAAKVVKSAFEIGLEFFGILDLTRLTRRLLGISSLELSIVLTIVFIVLGIFLFKYDWASTLGRTQSREDSSSAIVTGPAA